MPRRQGGEPAVRPQPLPQRRCVPLVRPDAAGTVASTLLLSSYTRGRRAQAGVSAPSEGPSPQWSTSVQVLSCTRGVEEGGELTGAALPPLKKAAPPAPELAQAPGRELGFESSENTVSFPVRNVHLAAPPFPVPSANQEAGHDLLG